MSFSNVSILALFGIPAGLEWGLAILVALMVMLLSPTNSLAAFALILSAIPHAWAASLGSLKMMTNSSPPTRQQISELRASLVMTLARSKPPPILWTPPKSQ